MQREYKQHRRPRRPCFPSGYIASVTARLERLGEYGEATLFASHLDVAGTTLPVHSIDSPHFLCLLGGDFTKTAASELVQLVTGLIEAGACYFICWGDGCEAVHDLIDDILIGDDRFASEETIIMTTWHSDETIEDALFFLLCAASPAEHYLDQPLAKLALVVDQPGTFETVHSALMEPAEFVAKMTA